MISYDLHNARSDAYRRLDKALSTARYSKAPDIDTVWSKAFPGMDKDSAIVAAQGEFERLAKFAGHADYTLDIFSSDTEMKMLQVRSGPAAYGRAAASAINPARPRQSLTATMKDVIHLVPAGMRLRAHD